MRKNIKINYIPKQYLIAILFIQIQIIPKDFIIEYPYGAKLSVGFKALTETIRMWIHI